MPSVHFRENHRKKLSKCGKGNLVVLRRESFVSHLRIKRSWKLVPAKSHFLSQALQMEVEVHDDSHDDDDDDDVE